MNDVELFLMVCKGISVFVVGLFVLKVTEWLLSEED